MREYLVLSALALGLVLGTGCNKNTSSVTDPNPNTLTPMGTVTGVLRDSVTLVPIPGATITILNQTATTGTDGTFTIANVPANTAVGNAGNGSTTYDSYIVTIDTTKVASAVGTYPKVSYSTVAVKYDSLGDATNTQTGTTTTNHATPVDGFVASVTCQIGKLDGIIVVQVAKNTDMQPLAGASVALYANSTSTDTSVGALGNLVSAYVTTDANGNATFKGVEAGKSFMAYAQTTDLVWVGTEVVSTGADNDPSTYVVEQNAGLILTNQNTVAPKVTATAPANLASVPASTTAPTTVVFTFSEPIQNNPYAQVLTQGQAVGGGLWSGVSVTATAPNGGGTVAVPFTLSWDTTMTLLTVSLPTTLPNVTYALSLNGATGLLDSANNHLAIGTYSSMAFTTTPTAAVATPAAPKIAQDAINPYLVTWAPAANAWSYAVLVSRSRNGVVDTSYLHAPILTTATTYNLLADPTFMQNEWFNGTIPYSYSVTVVALTYTQALTDGTASNALPLVATKFTPTLPILTPDPNILTRVSWQNVAMASSYSAIVTRYRAGVQDAQVTYTQSNNSGSLLSGYFDIASPVGTQIFLGWNVGLIPYTYTIQVVATDYTGTLSAPSAVTTFANTAKTPAKPVPVIDYGITPNPLPTLVTWGADLNTKQFAVVINRFLGGVFDASNIAAPSRTTLTSLDVATTALWAGNGTNAAPYTYTAQVVALWNAGDAISTGVASATLNLTPPVLAAPTKPVLVRYVFPATEAIATQNADQSKVVFASTTQAAGGYQVIVNRFKGGVFDLSSSVLNPPITYNANNVGTLDLSNLATNPTWLTWWSTPTASVPDPVAYTYTVQVVALDASQSLASGVPSALVTLGDEIQPRMTAGVTTPAYTPQWAQVPGSQLVTGPVGQVTTYELSLSFDRPLNAMQLMNPALWSITKATSAMVGGPYVAGANEAPLPVITGAAVTYPGGAQTSVVLTLTQTQSATATAPYTWDPANLIFTFTGNDVSGLNVVNPNNQSWGANAGLVVPVQTLTMSQQPESNPANLLNPNQNLAWGTWSLAAPTQAGPVAILPGTGTADPNGGGTVTYKLNFVFTNDLSASPVNAVTLVTTDSNNGGAPNTGAADVAPAIQSTSWNAGNRTLSVVVSYTQNGNNTATWDPNHWVFKFRGITDVLGNPLAKGYANFSTPNFYTPSGFFTWNQTPTTTLVASDTNPYVRGNGLNLNYKVTVNTSAATGGGPAGNVYLYDALTPIGGPLALASGATFVTLPKAYTLLTDQGTHDITATFTPTGNSLLDFSPSTSTNVLAQVVQDQLPLTLTYTTPAPTYTHNVAIAANTPLTTFPAIGPNPVLTWTVSPALPTGLGIAPATGVISGTATTVTASAPYTVTATNSTGQTKTTVVTIAVL